MMNTCSCMSVTPRSAVSMGPRAVFSSDTKLMLGRLGGRPTEALFTAALLQYRHHDFCSNSSDRPSGASHAAQSQPLATQIPGRSLGGDHGRDGGLLRVPWKGATEVRRPRAAVALGLPEPHRAGAYLRLPADAGRVRR